MKDFLYAAENLISGMLPLVFLSLAGLYFTLKTRGLQFRKFFTAIKHSLGVSKVERDGISSFGAVCNSLAATVGTGNIAGVAAAISIGGAGAVFWMWVSAFFGMVVKVIEITVSVANRKKNGSNYYGGPMYYIKQNRGRFFSFLATVFSVSCVFSAFTTGNITQVNASVAAINTSIIVKIAVGVIFAALVGVVSAGGAKKITRFTTMVLPFMAILYIALCLGVIIKNITLLDDALKAIFKGAFSPRSVTGGAVGSLWVTVITGAQKGIFSSEAGLGTAGIAHAAARDASVKTQGLFGIFEVFVDTLLICTLTALTILCSGVIIDYKEVASSELVSASLGILYGKFSDIALIGMLVFFAISSVLGWAAYGIEASRFLWGAKGERRFICVYPFFCIVGAVTNANTAFRMAEFFNGIMLIINVFAVLYKGETATRVLKGVKNESKDRKTSSLIAKR